MHAVRVSFVTDAPLTQIINLVSDSPPRPFREDRPIVSFSPSLPLCPHTCPHTVLIMALACDDTLRRYGIALRALGRRVLELRAEAALYSAFAV